MHGSIERIDRLDRTITFQHLIRRQLGRLLDAIAHERTQRRTAEAQGGGISSQESAERYASGENPGGTHAAGGPEGVQSSRTEGAGDGGETEGVEGGGKPNTYEDIGVKKGRG